MVKIRGYEIYRDGSEIGTVNTAPFTDKGLVPNKIHSYSVQAMDTSGDISGDSTVISAITKADGQA